MQTFFQTRRQQHQRQMQRYLKYVVNDHFALLVTFLLGGLGFYYANVLKTLPTPFVPGKYLLFIFFLLSLFFGRFASLTKPADALFLLPQETNMAAYLRAAVRYSCYLPFVALFLITGALMPLIFVSLMLPSWYFAIFIATLWQLKWAHLQLKGFQFYQESARERQKTSGLWLLVAIATLACSIFVQPFVGLCVATAFTIFVIWRYCYAQRIGLQWHLLITTEQERLQSVYQTLSLFTDVPQLQPKIRRRKYLDWLIKHWSPKQKAPFFYLYIRRFWRNVSFSHLYVRLVVVAGIFVYFTDILWLRFALGLLFLWLIGIQLIPLYQQVNQHLLTQLYPGDDAQRISEFRRLMWLLLFLASLLLSVIFYAQTQEVMQASLFAGGYFIFSLLFGQFYVARRVKKAL